MDFRSVLNLAAENSGSSVKNVSKSEILIVVFMSVQIFVASVVNKLMWHIVINS